MPSIKVMVRMMVLVFLKVSCHPIIITATMHSMKVMVRMMVLVYLKADAHHHHRHHAKHESDGEDDGVGVP